jgi:hypothetical protein
MVTNSPFQQGRRHMFDGSPRSLAHRVDPIYKKALIKHCENN